jgi:hypothetical protein
MKKTLLFALALAGASAFAQQSDTTFTAIRSNKPAFLETGIHLTQVGDEYYQYDCNGEYQSMELLDILNSISTDYVQMPSGVVQDVILCREYDLGNEWIVVYFLMDQGDGSLNQYSANYSGNGRVAVGCVKRRNTPMEIKKGARAPLVELYF